MNIKRVVTTIDRSWVHAYLDDDMGTLMLVTDWGNWTHRWGLSGLPEGVSFSDFIFGTWPRTDYDYIAAKLYYGRDDGREWDEKATKRALRIVVAKAFRRGLYGANTCVQMMREIEWAETFDDLMRSDYLDVVPDDCVTKPSWNYLHLRDVILPALQRQYMEDEAKKYTPRYT